MASNSKQAKIVSSPPQRPQLSEDILYIVAQKMLFSKPTTSATSWSPKVDLRQENAHTSFMCLNQMTRKVFYAQFIRMQDIEFDGSDVCFYRDKRKASAWHNNNEKDKEFYGPYWVTKAFIKELFDFGKLHPKSVKTLNCFWGKAATESCNNSPCRFAVQSFAKLLLNKELSNDEAEDMHFELDKLEINEHSDVLSSNFAEFLNLNVTAMDIELREQNHKLFDCTLFSKSFEANRVEKFCITISWVEDPSGMSSNWATLIDFLLDQCPNIRQIEFKIWSIEFREFAYADQIDQIVHQFEQSVYKISEEILPNLSKGNSKVKIMAAFKLFCDDEFYQGLPLDDKNVFLFKMGEELVNEDVGDFSAYTGRQCQVVDAIGRGHKCVFQVFASEVSYGSEVMQELLDDLDMGWNDEYDYDNEPMDDYDEDYDDYDEEGNY